MDNKREGFDQNTLYFNFLLEIMEISLKEIVKVRCCKFAYENIKPGTSYRNLDIWDEGLSRISINSILMNDNILIF